MKTVDPHSTAAAAADNDDADADAVVAAMMSSMISCQLSSLFTQTQSAPSSSLTTRTLCRTSLSNDKLRL